MIYGIKRINQSRSKIEDLEDELEAMTETAAKHAKNADYYSGLAAQKVSQLLRLATHSQRDIGGTNSGDA